ncbi:MAG: type II toxin-antitoxin system RelE/ParE family toxin [Acidobacteria bacterium]|nr:type II toxin-antitoxin system RelE/ParE family toxin [Acidobacteriota bacterium]MBV9624342.1 type II toxin-antitoxin system RelE/ParE family toxin [Acidobacteriota bacterium]
MGAKRLEYHQGAISDVKSAVAWYQKRSPKAALDFLEELQQAAKTIRQAPERWPLGKNNTRRFLLWRFPFSLIYSEQEAVITIWAVAHGSRRPEYWTRRL